MNRIRLSLFIGCAALTAFYAGCADETARTGKFSDEEMASIPFPERDNLPILSGGLVLSVDTETITVGEIVAPVMKVLGPVSQGDIGSFAFRAGPIVRDAVTNKVTDILLYKEARKQAPENIDEVLEKAVENEVKKFLVSHDNDYAEAQKELQKRGMDWQQYREYQKKLMLTQSYYVSQNLLEDKPISHSEMLAYYEAMKEDGFQFKGYLTREDVIVDGMIEFRLIDIVRSKLDADEINPDSHESRRDAALRKARTLMQKIRNGADFAELAVEHSHGHRASMGGLWTPVGEDSSLVGPYAVLQGEAEKMEAGAVAGPVESGEHVFIVKLEKKQIGKVTPFAELQKQIELDIQWERKKERFEKLVDELMAQADISNLDPFINACIANAWRRSKADETDE